MSTWVWPIRRKSSPASYDRLQAVAILSQLKADCRGVGSWKTSVATLFSAALLLILIGGALYVSARVGLPLGRLPGDIRIEWRGGGFYFPIVTSILLSVVLTVPA